MEIPVYILDLVSKEMNRANTEHWPLPINNPERVVAILAEEVGEVAAATLDISRPVSHHHLPEHLRALPLTHVNATLISDWRKQHLREEIVQVAATAINWLNALDARDQHAEPKTTKGEDKHVQATD